MGYASTARTFTWGLGEIIRRLGQERIGERERSTRWRIGYLSKMVAAGFPKPLPVLIGDTLTDEVCAKSRWPIAEVEAWFENRTPPGGTSASEVEARRAGESDMDDRAAQIGRAIAGRNLRVIDGDAGAAA